MNSKQNEEQCAEVQCAELTNAETIFTSSISTTTITSLPVPVSSQDQAIESNSQSQSREGQEKKMIKTNSHGDLQAQHRPLHVRPMAANGSTSTTGHPAASSTSKRKRERALSSDNTASRDLGGLMLPMKLHLMLDRYESERRKRKSNAASTTTNNASSKKQKTGQNENHQDMNNKDKNNDRIIIGWLPSGTAFKIYDEERFVREIMPSYFSSSNQSQEEQCSFEDFKRSLALWGFTDMPCVEGPTTRKIHVISHPKFSRGQPSACRAMRFRSMIQRNFVLRLDYNYNYNNNMDE